MPDGSKAKVPISGDDPRFDLYRQREKHIHTIGNLTLITGNLNGSISNAAWDVKRPEILNNSSLPINQTLRQYDNWNEETIEERGQWLFEQAKKIWSRA